MSANSKNVWIGFDLGGTKMLTVAYDDKWKELGRRRRKTRGRRDDSDKGINRVVSTIERLLSDCEISKSQIAGIGIGCPGPIDLEKGRLLMTANLGWGDVAVADVLKKKFDCNVIVVNDVDAGVYGEYHFGAAKGARCAVGIFPGTGVGGGCVYEDNILQGAGISCMEIGHIRISGGDKSSGSAIPGSLEAEASRLSIAAESAKAAHRGAAPYLYKDVGTDIANIRSGALADSIKHGDKVVKRLVEEAAETIGFAVASIVHLLAPDKVVLGGGMVEAMEDLMIGTVRSTAKKNVMSVYKDRFEVVAAKLGDDAGVQGAAAWAKRKLS